MPEDFSDSIYKLGSAGMPACEGRVDETWTDKALREVHLLGSGIAGFGKAAEEAIAWEHLPETAGKLVLSAGIGIAMARFPLAKGLACTLARAAGTGMGLAFLCDIATNGGQVAGALTNAWHSDCHWDADVSTMQNSLGKFGFDSLLMMAGGLGGGRIGKSVWTLKIGTLPNSLKRPGLGKKGLQQSIPEFNAAERSPASEISDAGTSNPAATWQATADTALRIGNYTQAELALTNLLACQRETSAGHEVITTVEKLADCKARLNKYSEAAPLLREATEYYAGSKDHFASYYEATCRMKLAGCHRLQGDREAAAPEYDRALALCRNWPTDPLTRMCLDRYKLFLQSTGRSREAELVDARLRGFMAPLPDLSIINRPAIPQEYRQTDEAARASQWFDLECIWRDALPPGFVDKGTISPLAPPLIDHRNGQIVLSTEPVTIVNPVDDTGLRLTGDNAELHFGSLRDDPEALAAALTQHTMYLFKPETAVDLLAWRREFRQDNAGKFVWLSDYAAMKRGVCNERALTLKALADRMGLNLTLRRGFCGNEPHDFTTLDQGGYTKIYDPGRGIFGEDISAHPEYESPFAGGTWD